MPSISGPSITWIGRSNAAARFLGVLDDEGVDALDQRMLEPLADRPAAPFRRGLLGAGSVPR
jgi:hypothetical protein